MDTIETEKKRYLTKLHGEILTIMDEIHRICQENRLHYYLAGGTLLGAKRHQGFIPWDDDLDIVMPRADFEKFIEHAKEWLSADFSLEWITTNTQYVLFFAKVSKKGTMFVDSPYTKPIGIFIDIFPLDLSPGFSSRIKWKKLLIQKLNNVMWYKLGNNNFPKKLYMWLPSLLLGFQQVHSLIKHIALSASKSGTSHYANFGSQYSIAKQTMPVEWYGDGELLKFEGRKYVAPIQSDKVLTSIFGPLYMEIPPENKRRSHYPMKVTFSDGETMTFEYAHKVSVKEQEG